MCWKIARVRVHGCILVPPLVDLNLLSLESQVEAEYCRT